MSGEASRLIAAVRRRPLPYLVWVTPAVVFLVVRLAPGRTELAIGALLGITGAAVASRHPARSLTVLVLLLPFQQFVLALLYRLGVPASVVRPLGLVKEFLIGAVVVAAAQQLRSVGWRPDTMDKLVVGYLALVAAYLVAPAVFVDHPLPMVVRLQSARTNAVFLVLFFAARAVPLTNRDASRLAKAVLGAGIVVAGVGVIEFFFSAGWNTIVLRTFELGRYRADVFGLPNTTDIRFYDSVAGRNFTRIGSVQLDALKLAFYLCIGFGLALDAAVRRGRPHSRLACALLGTAVVLTFTRSAILGILAASLVALRPHAQRSTSRRAQIAVAALALVLCALPALAGTGLAARAVGAFTGDDPSTAVHQQRFERGAATLLQRPLGLGLGTGASVDLRYRTGESTENSYLQVGNELGVIAMLLFVVLLIVVVRRLHEGGRAEGDTAALAGGLSLAGVALLVGGLFLHVWIDFDTTWTFWAGAGVALNLRDRQRAAKSYFEAAHR